MFLTARNNAFVAMFTLDGQWDMSLANKEHQKEPF
jgi:hypothetical protein